MIVTRPRSDSTLATATCTASESVGDLVYISGPKSGADYSVSKVDIANYAKMPAVAVVVYKITATRAVIQFGGETGLFSGLTPGKVYWVSDAGVPTATPPTVTAGQRKYWQSIGVAVDSGKIRLEFIKDLKTKVG